VTAAQIAAAAAEMISAGVAELHVHPKTANGADTLRPDIVSDVVAAVRAAVPGVPIGVTTGAWAEPDPARRAALIRAWPAGSRPDYASVNWHEDGATEVAHALLDGGIGIEAGLYSGTSGPEVLERSGLAGRMYRVLAEVVETDPARCVNEARRHFQRVFALADATGRRPLLHGEDAGAWPVLGIAAALEADQRIGLEDVLVDPAGMPATNAALVLSARGYLRN
jgi:uncharacterized protein (DUF849 family)